MTDLNITGLADVGVGNLFCQVNNSTDGILIGGFIIALFFIMILVLKKWDFSKAFLVSSWSCFIVSLIATSTTCADGTRFLSAYYALIFLLMTGFVALYMWASGEE